MNEISGRTNINQRGFSGAASDSDGGDETFMDLIVSHAARLLLSLSSFSSVHHRTACPSRSKRVLSGDGAADGQMDASVLRFRPPLPPPASAQLPAVLRGNHHRSIRLNLPSITRSRGTRGPAHLHLGRGHRGPTPEN